MCPDFCLVDPGLACPITAPPFPLTLALFSLCKNFSQSIKLQMSFTIWPIGTAKNVAIIHHLPQRHVRATSVPVLFFPLTLLRTWRLLGWRSADHPGENLIYAISSTERVPNSFQSCKDSVIHLQPWIQMDAFQILKVMIKELKI